jgi:hypothetical protein
MNKSPAGQAGPGVPPGEQPLSFVYDVKTQVTGKKYEWRKLLYTDQNNKSNRWVQKHSLPVVENC